MRKLLPDLAIITSLGCVLCISQVQSSKINQPCKALAQFSRTFFEKKGLNKTKATLVYNRTLKDYTKDDDALYYKLWGDYQDRVKGIYDDQVEGKDPKFVLWNSHLTQSMIIYLTYI